MGVELRERGEYEDIQPEEQQQSGYGAVAGAVTEASGCSELHAGSGFIKPGGISNSLAKFVAANGRSEKCSPYRV